MVKTKLTQKMYDGIKDLVDQALIASNKSVAKKYADRLEFLALDLEGAALNVLHDLCASVKNASGRVSDKESKEYFCQMDLYKLKRFIEN